VDRRKLIGATFAGAAGAAFSGALWREAFAAPAQPGPSPYGDLSAADGNGIQLPAGFSSRVIARSGQRVPGTSYSWHWAPDGGACFADGNGWIYVSNSEIPLSGGASAVRFDAGGNVISASRQLCRRRDPLEHLAFLRGGRAGPGDGDRPVGRAARA
jgi:hypothetical protein